jgi:RNA polymerase sigma-70 factor (ECF subfamily)
VKFSDEALIEEIRSGSKSAYGQLMERYERLVFSIAVSVVRNTDDALDISQDVFLKAYQKLDLYSGKGAFKAWLARIAHNESIDWLRKQKQHEDVNELAPGITPSVAPDQELQVVKDERWKILSAEIGRLNLKQQIALKMRYFQGMPIRDIAGVLECSEGNVKSLLFRGVDKLRNQLRAQRRMGHEGM